MSSPSSNESSASSSPCSSSGSFVSCPYCISQAVVDELAIALNELSLETPPEPDTWREEELDRLSLCRERSSWQRPRPTCLQLLDGKARDIRPYHDQGEW